MRSAASVPLSSTPSPPPAAAGSGEPSPSGAARGTVYFLLLRLVVTTLLMLVAFASELAEASPTVTPQAKFLFALIGFTYATTLSSALLLRSGRAPRWVVPVQVTADILAVTLVVHATGGAESGFVFLYLLLIVGVSSVLSRRGLTHVALLGAFAYIAVSMGGRLDWLPMVPGTIHFEDSLGQALRTLAVNLIAFAATALLARRLAVELERAGEHIAAQELHLDEIAALHADVVEALTSGLVTVANDGRVASYNRAAEELLGLPVARAIGRPLSELLPGLPPIPASGTLRRGELRLELADGSERWFGVSISPLVTASHGRIGLVVNFQDLTELRRMREQVQRAEQLAALGRMAAGVAHEIRNPLAAISGAIELLGGITASDQETRELMAIVMREVERLDHLLAELLEFARPRPPAMAPLELTGTVRELSRVLAADRRVAAHRLELDLGEPLWIEADPGQLRQVLWNLVRNATEAAPLSTPITLSVHATSDASGRWARLAVRDRGLGIPPTDRERLFEPFFSTKQGGTGLGLAIVHRIVEAHGGQLDVLSPPDGGAEFVIRLPATPTPSTV